MAHEELLGFLKILVRKDVWRCPDDPEANPVPTGIARRKGIAFDHDDIVRAAVRPFVDCFIDATLRDGLARAKASTLRRNDRFAMAPAASGGPTNRESDVAGHAYCNSNYLERRFAKYEHLPIQL